MRPPIAADTLWPVTLARDNSHVPASRVQLPSAPPPRSLLPPRIGNEDDHGEPHQRQVNERVQKAGMEKQVDNVIPDRQRGHQQNQRSIKDEPKAGCTSTL